MESKAQSIGLGLDHEAHVLGLGLGNKGQVLGIWILNLVLVSIHATHQDHKI